MTLHQSTSALLAYLEQVDDGGGATHQPVADHLATCAGCAARASDVQEFTSFLRDPELWRDVDRASPPTFDLPFQLSATELEVRRLVTEANILITSYPERALSILEAADALSDSLESPWAQAELKSEIWKERANAYRIAGKYRDGIRAAESAIEWGEWHPVSDFSVAQAIYTRGTLYAQLGLFESVVADATEAAARFAMFGDSRRVAHARLLEAIARAEQGDLVGATRVYETVRTHLERVGDAQGVAHVVANMAVVHLRLYDYEAAAKLAAEARDRHAALGNVAESIRSDWTAALVALGRGDTEIGARLLMRVAGSFAARGMSGEVAFVKLDLVETYLRLDEWARAEHLAREAADEFARSGAAVHVTTALAYLRDATAHRRATTGLVRYVRQYVESNDPAQAFAPPVQ